jgi:alpha-N-arabinofuranosidase
MLTSYATINPAYTVGPIPRRLFGSFVEHMGRCVYGGIFEPGHPVADDDGLRKDVASLVRELGVSVVRYPGGNFVSGYRWEDGVGPVDGRPTRLDLAWRSLESNHFGTNEFMKWCRLVDVEPMMAVNLGTRGIQNACDLLEYTNRPGGTYYSDLRARHGYADPHGVKLWCLGNEMDGPWQIGHMSADEYGRLATETARAMRRVDPSIELVACGSSNAHMPTFGQWEATVLDHSYDDVDYISLHAYYEQGHDDLGTFLASGAAMDKFIEGIIATVDHIGAKKRSAKRLKLSFDEWNLWGETDYAGHPDVPWTHAPRLIEETYDAADAVVFASLLMSLLRHADRIGIACLAQLVNVIAPIRAEANSSAWRQTIFYPFALMAQHARGEVLQVQQTVQRYSTNHGDVETVDLAATRNPDTEEVVLLAVNRDQHNGVMLDVDLRAFVDLTVAEHLVLGGTELDLTNTQDVPERVLPRPVSSSRVSDRHLVSALPPISWSIIRLAHR